MNRIVSSGAFALVLLAACSEPGGLSSRVQEVRTGGGGHLGVDVLVTDDDGEAIPCGVGSLTATVAISRGGEDGPFETVPGGAVELSCTSKAADLALVVDNSGSQSETLAALTAASDHAAGAVLDGGGRTSIVRVSSNASVLAELTTDRAALDAAIDGMFVNRGWTALWDGVRLGNQTLGGGVTSIDQAPVFEDAATFCASAPKRGILVFSNGADNNSADEHTTDFEKYPGDGVATTLADLGGMRVDGVTTPVYPVALGDDADLPALQALADQTGGVLAQLDDGGDLEAAFAHVAEYLRSTHQVCADLSSFTCGPLTVRVDYTWTSPEGQVHTAQKLQDVDVPCPTAAPSGRVATMLLTMSNPGIPRDVAVDLAGRAVSWVSPVADPQVLLVRDDDHHGEATEDTAYIRDLLIDAGVTVTLVDEPSDGLGADASAYDVVWFTNPGYPWDDAGTAAALQALRAAGGGVVLSGDDMSWSWGFDVAQLTGLDYVDNGTSTCGRYTDNNGGAFQSIEIVGEHPVTAGLALGPAFTYGDDLDHTVPRPGTEVLAEAVLEVPGCTSRWPAIVAVDPSAATD